MSAAQLVAAAAWCSVLVAPWAAWLTDAPLRDPHFVAVMATAVLVGTAAGAHHQGETTRRDRQAGRGIGRAGEREMLTGEQITDIENRAEAYVAGLDLRDESTFRAAVEAQLARLTDPPIQKRRATVLALAEVGLTGEASRRAVFLRNDTVRIRTFYNKQKDWFYGETFREVLEIVVRLYRKWSARATALAAADEFNEKLDSLRAAEHEIGSKMFDLARQMAASPLYEVVATGEDGRDVTLKPARWTMADLPRVAKGASELTRLALGMAPGGRQEVAVNWTEHLPDGITPAQAEAAMESWARILAAADAGDDGEDEDE